MRECHAELGNLIHAFEGTLEHCRRRRPGPVQLSDPFPGSLRMARENGCRDAVAAGGAGRKMARASGHSLGFGIGIGITWIRKGNRCTAPRSRSFSTSGNGWEFFCG
jgi:hypothetical protein